ncbi:PQQ-binding-like beta-propeller repeat protein [Candidatus Poribacteria bacterium]|nr:PQQ-binding-like beta-propeller repeat protein [Candidatus Poribacteria bacterium]MYG06766.1 PQQ-binding-like beta-propeller repeat protein [Candidatus Poribacteria bacterium]MYK25276.1 PQQ-binding-like beta-propeller repeat protein [Candidatus Poribacteria bacterium]
MALSIEAIDEQNIPFGTKDYVLEIDIGGEPDRAYVDGSMEGFYQSWDAQNAKLKIIADNVTRILEGEIWNVHLIKGTETLDAQIIYNVVSNAPVIIDPGRQEIWKGELFKLGVKIENEPSVARGNAFLAGLKYVINSENTGIDIEGKLPITTILTETAFDGEIYAETDGGSDQIAVPFTIREHTGIYVFNEERTLTKIDTDTGTVDWTYQAPLPVDSPILPGTVQYVPLIVVPNGIYLFSPLSNHLLKVSPDGELLWTFRDAENGRYNILATLSGLYMYRSGRIYKIDEKTGKLIYDIEAIYDDLILHEGSLYLFRDTTRVDDATDTLTKLDELGEVVWTYQAPAGSYTAPVGGGDGIYLFQENAGILRKIDANINMLKKSAETPKQINPTELKRGFG